MNALYGGMNRVYYTHGVPFVVLRVPASANCHDLPPLTALQGRFRSALIGSLAFHEIAPSTYGFRRQFFQPAWFPGNLMHGMLQFDREKQQVIMKGFLNIWIALLVLVVAVFSVLSPFPGWSRVLPLAIAVLVIGVPLTLERRRCVELARCAAASPEGN